MYVDVSLHTDIQYFRAAVFDTVVTDVRHTQRWLKLPVGIPGVIQYISDEETVQIGCGCINDLEFEIFLNSYIQCDITQNIVFHSQYAGLFSL